MWTYPGLIEVASSTSPLFLLPSFRPMEFNAKLNVAHPALRILVIANWTRAGRRLRPCRRGSPVSPS